MLTRILPASVLALVLVALPTGCGGGGSSGSLGLETPQATVALGDTGANDLSELSITFHELGVSGSGVTAYVIQEGVDAPVTVNALDYQGSAATLGKKLIEAGSYDTLFFKVTMTAKDLGEIDVPVYPMFAQDGSTYDAVETVFPLGPNEFTVAAPAEENQPFLFLHIDVAQSVAAGDVDGTIRVAPQIFLSTRIHMDIDATVTQVDAAGGVLEVEDAKGTLYVVQPTTCTMFVGGFDAASSGVGTAVLFDNVAVGDVLHLSGTLGVDPGCDDANQKATFFHPHFVRGEFSTVGITIVNGLVESVSTIGETTQVTLLVGQSTDASTGGPGAIDSGEHFTADFASTLLYTGRGEVQDLTSHADRLQIGERIGVGAENVTETDPGEFSGLPRLGFLEMSNLCGMIEAVDDQQLTLDATGAKKDSGDPFACASFLQSPGPGSAPLVALAADTDVVVGAGSEIKVGPKSGWTLTQVVDPWYDNQLRGPAHDGMSFGIGPCSDSAGIDYDFDAGALTAYVDHRIDGSNAWTINRLQIDVASDATQKYVAWEDGVPACSMPANNAYLNNPCIATSSKHRQALVLGDSFAPNWVNLAQSGAGAFGTSILNAGARIPGAAIPPGSDTPGWDDVNERVLLGIDFDGDMYPFDEATDNCSNVQEVVWVDLSQAQFFYFNRDPITDAIDMQYLNTYADFKAKVIQLQDDQQANACGPGFHENAGFGFTGLIDKTSFIEGAATTIVPVIRAIDGRVFNGGCMPDAN
ncbi:MAG: DUF4382 domain-containing protein [Planctomycetes bacterium]|nr:DUF4382 domain-containing protein [Planctomycetota bacterium]